MRSTDYHYVFVAIALDFVHQHFESVLPQELARQDNILLVLFQERKVLVETWRQSLMTTVRYHHSLASERDLLLLLSENYLFLVLFDLADGLDWMNNHITVRHQLDGCNFVIGIEDLLPQHCVDIVQQVVASVAQEGPYDWERCDAGTKAGHEVVDGCAFVQVFERLHSHALVLLGGVFYLVFFPFWVLSKFTVGWFLVLLLPVRFVLKFAWWLLKWLLHWTLAGCLLRWLLSHLSLPVALLHEPVGRGVAIYTKGCQISTSKAQALFHDGNPIITGHQVVESTFKTLTESNQTYLFVLKALQSKPREAGPPPTMTISALLCCAWPCLAFLPFIIDSIYFILL
jgi:hypothetical protein